MQRIVQWKVGKEHLGVSAAAPALLAALRNTNYGFGAPEPAGHDDAGDRGQDDGAKDCRSPLPDDLLDNEENRGGGSVEGCGECCGISSTAMGSVGEISAPRAAPKQPLKGL